MLVLVVGPSGAGKDSLINGAKAVLSSDPRFVFPRRVVTREAVASLEDHESLSREEFDQQMRNGAFALSWEAHGLCYGLPARLAGDLTAGRIVVFNGSRAIVAMAQEQFPDTRVVLVDAAPEVRAKRLAGRGREGKADIAARLAREVPQVPADAVRIDNSGSLDEGVARFVAALRVLTAL